MVRTANKVINESGVKFGTSGARGLVDQFTSEVCGAFTVSFIETIRKEFEFSRISIAIDRRPSSPKMAEACCTMAQVLGVEVEYFGVLPTPALAYHSMQAKQPAIMITGSHIPFDRNGIKFYRPDGEISKADEALIVNTDVIVPDVFDSVLPVKSDKAQTNYLKRYLQIVPTNLLKGKRVGIYQHSSAGRDLYHQLFNELGAEVIVLGRSEVFVPIDTEAVQLEDVEQGKEWTKNHKLDCLFSTDGDGDRPLIADEKGQWLRGDIVGLLTAKFLGIQALSVPVSCNTAIEKCGSFGSVVRTKVGSPFVIEVMQNLQQTYDRVAGFEANGGFLLGSDIEINNHVLTSLSTRDAILPVLALMALSEQNQKPLSQLVSELPKRYAASNRLQDFATEKSQQLIRIWTENPKKGLVGLDLADKIITQQDETDGLRWTFTDQTIVHLRPSGNAPELRCYVEAETEQSADELLKNCIAALLKF